MKTTPRHQARAHTLQAIYQWQISGSSIDDIEKEFLTEHITEKTDMDYFKELIHNIPKNIDDLDQHITPFIKRPIHEIDQIELAVLRISTYELSKRLEIPYRVIINEALELTKKFGSIEGYKFVNGVLDQVARQLRKDEIKK